MQRNSWFLYALKLASSEVDRAKGKTLEEISAIVRGNERLSGATYTCLLSRSLFFFDSWFIRVDINGISKRRS